MTSTDERRAPVQGHWRPRGQSRPGGTIAWSEHVLIREAYARRCGKGQDAERIAQRGGFAYDDIIMFLGRAPETWEPLKGETR
jgi:hypothetical protein